MSYRDRARDAALAAGHRFFIGKPCSLGHRKRYVRDAHCVACSIARGKAAYNTPIERAQRNERFRKMRATPEAKARTAEKRLKITGVPPAPLDGVCQCCASEGHWTVLHCDHNHETKMFRGWVCRGCNTGSGIIDNPARLRMRADFLERAL